MKRKSKLTTVMLVIVLTVMSCIPAAAATQKLTLNPLSGFDSYHFTWSEKLYTSGITKLYLNDEVAFCIQAFRAIRDKDGNQYMAGTTDTITTNYAEKELTKDNSIQSKIAYLGYYSLPKPTNKDYAFTQMYIWQSLPATDKTSNGKDPDGNYRSYFVNTSLRKEYEAWRKSIDKKIDSWNTRPSFYGKTINITAGSSLTLTDSNKVLEDYNAFTFTKNGVTIKHSKGSNTLSVSVAKSCQNRSLTMYGSEIKTAGGQKYDDQVKSNYVYNADNSQDVAVYGSMHHTKKGVLRTLIHYCVVFSLKSMTSMYI